MLLHAASRGRQLAHPDTARIALACRLDRGLVLRSVPHTRTAVGLDESGANLVRLPTCSSPHRRVVVILFADDLLILITN